MPAPSRSTCPRSIACSRSTPSRARHSSRPALGPGLEAQLGEHGLTLRHYPQSFEYSTLGGWIATRAAGHFATVQTHIEDFVESMRAITPGGRLGVAPAARLGRRRQPRSDARRLGGHARGHHRRRGCASSRARAPRVGGRALRALRATARSACARSPSRGCTRQLPPARRGRGAHDDGRRRLRTRCSCSASSPPTIRSTRRWLARSRSVPSTAARSRARAGTRCRGAWRERERGRRAVSSWRSAFLGAPYLRDVLVAMGVLGETFETAITWERFPAFHEHVTAAVPRRSLREPARAGRGSSLPLHPRLSRRSRALLHRARARPPRRGGRAVGGDQARRLRRDDRRRRHDHPSPRGRARAPALV